MANNNQIDNLGCSYAETGAGDPVDYHIDVPPLIYQLTGGRDLSNVGGDLDVRARVSIFGAGPTLTVIDADGIDRVFEMLGPNAYLSLHDLQITGGITDDRFSRDGAGILVGGGHLRTHNLLIQDNHSMFNGGGVGGGGLIEVGTDTVFRSNSANPANLGSGGGLFVGFGTAIADGAVFESNTLGGISSTANLIVRNSVVRDNLGRGVFLLGEGETTITGSVIISNEGSAGAGVYGGPGAQIDIANTTIAFNRGIGVYSDNAVFRLTHVSVVQNSSSFAGSGVGIATGFRSGPMEISNSIVAGNGSDTGAQRDCDGEFISRGFNLIGVNNGCQFTLPAGGPNQFNDWVGTVAIPQDPELEPFDATTGAFAPRPDSRVLNQIPASACRFLARMGNTEFMQDQPVTSDQLDNPRQPNCDIGAIEANNTPAPPLFADSFEVIVGTDQ